MAFCDNTTWNMRLKLNKAPGTVEQLDFLLAAGGVGQVKVQGTKMSDLNWSCQTLGMNKALMSFIFRFRRHIGTTMIEMGVLFTGFAKPDQANPPKAVFIGRLQTFTLDSDVPAGSTAQLQLLAPDPGDTGTGTGSQT